MNNPINRLNSRTRRARREAEHSPLRAARLEKGLSQAELAAQAGLSPGWISLIERTPHFITPRTAQALAEVLGLSEQELRP
jgi:transcriptional regulator with XRE-family HTH domain